MNSNLDGNIFFIDTRTGDKNEGFFDNDGNEYEFCDCDVWTKPSVVYLYFIKKEQ